MALQNQIVNLPIGGGDVTFKNYGGTDIAANTAVLFDTANAGTSQDPAGVVVPTAAGGVVGTIGITVETLKAGGKGRVRMLGAIWATANGAVTGGTIVQASDTAAKLGQVKTCAAATAQIGIALNTAADQDPVLVWVQLAKNA